jgi:hypothetical protein
MEKIIIKNLLKEWNINEIMEINEIQKGIFKINSSENQYVLKEKDHINKSIIKITIIFNIIFDIVFI